MIEKVFYAILAVFLLLGVMVTPINDGIKGWRTDDTTQGFAVETGGGVTTANVTLSGDLFKEDVAEVISISSNITETPVATTYTEATNYLLVSALAASETRTLTINYYAETTSVVIRALGGFMSLIIIGGLLFLIVRGMKGKRR